MTQGLFADVLPWVFSKTNQLRRGLFDPATTAQNMLADANTRAGGLLDMTRAATDEGMKYGPATQKLAGAMADAYNPIGMTVWHGSPHTFPKFDASKIGTGEGAQAYGHGLYFAESPAVAADYQRSLSTTVKVDGRPILRNNQVTKTGNSVIDDNLVAANGDLQRAVRDQLQALRDHRGYMAEFKQPGMQKALKDTTREFQEELLEMRRLRGRVETSMDGNLYKVDLPDEHIAKMLDLDKPLSQQPSSVQTAVSPFGFSPKVADLQGGEILNRLIDRLGGSAKVSDWLRQDGIPGIRYLDGGSRGAGTGTSNFVVFPGNEGLLSILERNGVPQR